LPDSAGTPNSLRNPSGVPTLLRQNRSLRWLTYLLLLPLIALATILFGCVSLISGIWDSSGRQQHLIARSWARVLLLLSLSPVQLVGLDHIQGGQTAVYASNHLSYYDTPVLFGKLPFQFRILAKQSLWKVPFVGWYLNRSGQVPIDAKSGRSAIAGLLRGVKTLQGGMPLVIFPEGGRSETGSLTVFQAGAAFMAIKAQVPLIPVALIGTYELLPIHTYHLSPRPLKIVIGSPFPTSGLSTRDAESLTTSLYEAISRLHTLHSGGTPASMKPQ
jgi:1-acyl-sn-glycerol-3-phosphate acyltransferase